MAPWAQVYLRAVLLGRLRLNPMKQQQSFFESMLFSSHPVSMAISWALSWRPYGRQAHTGKVSRGTAIGFSFYSCSGPEVVVDAAIESLEQWNGHLSVACLNAIEKGHGKVVRKGNILTITLPEHWKKF